MSDSEEPISEAVLAVKRVPKPRVAKIAKTAEIPIELIQPEPEEYKQVIVGFDCGFKKLGVAVLDLNCSYVESAELVIRPDLGKFTESQVEAHTNRHLKDIISDLYAKFDVQYVVIELELGEFACTPIETAIVGCLRDSTPFVVQHSKLKLKHPELKGIQVPNSESKQYNENKEMGRLLAEQIFAEFKSESFDEADALLHALYAFRNKDAIAWVKKDDIDRILE